MNKNVSIALDPFFNKPRAYPNQSLIKTNTKAPQKYSLLNKFKRETKQQQRTINNQALRMKTIVEQRDNNLGQGDLESFYLPFPNDKEQLFSMSSRTKRSKSVEVFETQQEEQPKGQTAVMCMAMSVLLCLALVTIIVIAATRIHVRVESTSTPSTTSLRIPGIKTRLLFVKLYRSIQSSYPLLYFFFFSSYCQLKL